MGSRWCAGGQARGDEGRGPAFRARARAGGGRGGASFPLLAFSSCCLCVVGGRPCLAGIHDECRRQAAVPRNCGRARLGGHGRAAEAPPIPLLWTTPRMRLAGCRRRRWHEAPEGPLPCLQPWGCRRVCCHGQGAVGENMPRGPDRDRRRGCNHWSASMAAAVDNYTRLRRGCSCG